VRAHAVSAQRVREMLASGAGSWGAGYGLVAAMLLWHAVSGRAQTRRDERDIRREAWGFSAGGSGCDSPEDG
jgi:hypothetical protein